MARIEISVQIAAPAELVFAFFVPQRMAYWYGSDMEACLEVQGGASDFAVAQKVRVTGHFGKREVSHTAVVTALQRARLFEWRFEDRYGVKGLERWEFQQVNDPPSGLPETDTPQTTLRKNTKTNVKMISAYTMPGVLGKAMDWMVTRHAVARRNQDYLARLKRYAEHGKPE
jgi:hypothetical protein